MGVNLWRQLCSILGHATDDDKLGFLGTESFTINVNVNVKNIYRRRRMSRVRIGGAGGRRNVRLSRMQQRTVLFSDVP